MECLVFNKVKNKINTKELEKVVFLSLKEIKKTKAEISLHLIGVAKMQKLNKIYRGKDKPTDVLSFASSEGVGFPGEINQGGDIFICIPVIKKQAKEYSVSFKEELNRMTIHGVLHVFGYDHEKTKKDALIMFTLQDKILRKSLK